MTPLLRILRAIGARLRTYDEHELDEEIRAHLELEITELERQGVPPREARRRALAAFGRVENVKDEVRDARPLARLLTDAAHDARIGLRSLSRQPVFVIAVIATLGLGIGGNVAMLGVLEASIFRSLPYPRPDELVLGRVTYEGEVGTTVSGPDFFDYRETAGSLAELDAFTPFPVLATVTGVGTAERVAAPFVSVGFFNTLGIGMAAGRAFTADEGEPDGPDVAILSHDYWQRRFGGDPSVVGRSIVLDGTPSTIVGVARPGFRFVIDADVWRPIRRARGWAAARQFHNFVLVGRRARGVPLAAAQAEVDLISERLAEAYPATNRDKGLNLTPLAEATTEGIRGPLALLTAAVGLLLLVACANVAGLLVVRGAGRRAELAIRSVMGAGSGRLARQLLTENGLLAVGAAAVGVAIAAWLQRGILAFLQIDGIDPADAALSPTMLGGGVLLTLVTVSLFGAAPAIRIARSEPAADLGSGRRTAGTARGGRLQNLIVAFQVAVTAVLLVVSGLLLRSFDELRGVDPGIDTAGLLTAEVPLPPGEYQDLDRRVQFQERLLELAAAIPGVTDAALISRLPIRDGGGNVRVGTPEEWGSGGVFERLAYQRMTMPGYFEAMGVPLIVGRDFARADGRGAPNVMIISAALADDVFPEIDPIGRALAVDVGEDEPWVAEVVGVVGDVVPSSLALGEDYTMYFSYGQRSPATMRLAVRTTPGATDVVAGLRGALASLDPDVPLAGVAAMDDVLSASISGRRSVMATLTVFAAVALLLSGVALYGLLAYQVSQRLHEIGVRMALGASVASVATWVLRRGLALVGIGLVAAIPFAVLAGRYVEGMLFSVGAIDPPTYLAVAAFLTGIAGLACIVPARRAARVDPADAFRAE